MQSLAHTLTLVQKNDKDSKFKVGIRRSKYKYFFTKDHAPNWTEEVFVIKNVKNAVPCRAHKLIVILMVKNVLKCVTKKNSKRQVKQTWGYKK